MASTRAVAPARRKPYILASFLLAKAFMPIFTVRHVTTYRYRRPLAFGEHRMMLRPRESYDQRLVETRLNIQPKPKRLRWINDVFGNTVEIARFGGQAEELRFEGNVVIDLTPQNTPDFQIDDEALTYPFAYDPSEAPDLAPWLSLGAAERNADVERWARRFLREKGPTETGELLMTLTAAIRESFVYVRRVEPGTQTPAETLALGRGTCRDFAVLMIAAVRSLGMAARFVSGYIYVPSRDRETDYRGGGSTHAWCQVYLPGAGWVDFDPTNGIVGNRDLIRVAVAREPNQAVPVWGTYAGTRADYLDLTVEVLVSRRTEPRAATGVAGGRG
jgi:transglutaminase-like putative cysteine protease